MAIDPNKQIGIDEEASTGNKWAREVTLAALLAESRGSSTVLRQMASTMMSADELKKTDEMVSLARKNITNSTVNADRTSATIRTSFSSFDTALHGSFKELERTMATLSYGGITAVLEKSALEASKKLTALSESTSSVGSTLIGVAGKFLEFSAVVLGAFDVVKELNTQNLKLFESGVKFSNGLDGMTKAAGDVGISTTELATTFTQFSGSVAYLGTDSAVKLAKRFTDLNRESNNLGMSNTEAAEAVMTYTDMLRTSGSLSGKSTDDLVKGASEYYQELNQLSVLTGKNRKELQKEIDARRKDPDFNLSLARLPGDVRENVLKSISSLSGLGDDTGKLIQESLGSIFSQKGPVGGITDAADRMILGTNARLQGLMELAANEAKTGAITKETKQAISKELKESALASASQLAGLPGPAGDAARKLVTMNMQNDAIEESNKRLMDQAKDEFAQHKTNESLQEIQNRLLKEQADYNVASVKTQNELDASTAKLHTAFQTMMVDVLTPLMPALSAMAKVVVVIAEGLNKVNEDISWLGTGITSLATSISSTLSPIIGKLATALESFLRMIGIEGPDESDDRADRAGRKPAESKLSPANLARYGIEAGLGIYGAKKVYGAGKGVVGGINMVRGLFGGGKGPGGIPGLISGGGIPGQAEAAMEKLSGATKGMTGGAGSSAKSFMQGIADGIASFGNKSVLAGIANLTLAGAGIAGILYLIAKASKAFADVSWEDMGKAGVALAGLGVTMTGIVVAFDAFGPAIETAGALVASAGVEFGIGLGALGAGLLPIAAAIWLVEPAIKDIGEVLASVFGDIAPIITSMSDLVKGLGVAMKSAGEGISAAAVGIGTGAEAAFKGAGEGIGAAIDGLGAGASKALSGAGDLASKAAKGLGDAAATVVDSFSRMNTASIDATTSQIERLSKVPGANMMDAAKGIEAMKSALDGFSPGIVGGISQFIGGFLSGDPVATLEKLSNLGDGLRNTAESMKAITGDLPKMLADIGGLKITDASFAGLDKIKDLFTGEGLFASFGSAISRFFGAESPLEQLKSFGSLTKPLSDATSVLATFATEFSNAIASLNGSKIDSSVAQTFTDLSKMIFTDTGAGWFGSGKITTASKIQELAESIGVLAAKTADLQSAQNGSAPGPKMLSPSDLQKRTISFYDDQKQSNASLIALLTEANTKLGMLNDTVSDGHSNTVRAIKSVGSVF